MKRVAAVLAFTFVMLGCSPIEQQARDSAAALQGALTTAQSKYQAQCTSNPTQQACTIINQAIAGQNALITATEAYCGWSASAPPQNPATASCTPVKSAQAGLQTAINNATLFIQELKGIIQ